MKHADNKELIRLQNKLQKMKQHKALALHMPKLVSRSALIMGLVAIGGFMLQLATMAVSRFIGGDALVVLVTNIFVYTVCVFIVVFMTIFIVMVVIYKLKKEDSEIENMEHAVEKIKQDQSLTGGLSHAMLPEQSGQLTQSANTNDDENK